MFDFFRPPTWSESVMIALIAIVGYCIFVAPIIDRPPPQSVNHPVEK